VAAEAENTFQTIAENWIEFSSDKNEWSVNYHSQVERTLKLHVFPALGYKPIASIKYPELEGVLEQVWSEGHRRPARSVAVLNMTMDFGNISFCRSQARSGT